MLQIQTLWKKIDSVVPIEKVTVRANLKPLFNMEIVSKYKQGKPLASSFCD